MAPVAPPEIASHSLLFHCASSPPSRAEIHTGCRQAEAKNRKRAERFVERRKAHGGGDRRHQIEKRRNAAGLPLSEQKIEQADRSDGIDQKVRSEGAGCKPICDGQTTPKRGQEILSTSPIAQSELRLRLFEE